MSDEWLLSAMDDDSISDAQITEHVRGYPSQTLPAARERRREIRRRYAAGGVTQQQLGDEYGVTQSTISRIINRQSGSSDPE